MNAGVLSDTLNSLWWWQLRHVAAEVGINSKGSRASLIETIAVQGEDPVRGNQVARAIADAQRECRRLGKKRRRATAADDDPSKNLEMAFECAALCEEEGVPSPTSSPAMIYFPDTLLLGQQFY